MVRGSELWFVDRSSFSLVCGSFVDRSDVRGSELWILGRSSFSLVRGSFGCAWIGAHRDRIGLGRSTGSLDRSSLSILMCCCAWIVRCVAVCAFVFCFASLFSLCCCAWRCDPEMN